MKSISPIIATILIIVMTVAIAGLFYAFTSGMFNSIISSSNNLINQQSKIISFTINNVYCSNNILYFNIYNNGNIPININNSQIIFTDNNGNTISINGSNIICNNGNIIPIGSNELCYVLNYSCYYNDIDYIKGMNFVYNGINYNYNILSNNKFNIIYYSSSNSSISSNSTSGSPTNTTGIGLGYIPITIYNTQSIPTPSPFQQDIAICNGNINIGNNFAYVGNLTLFNLINSNGSNVYFTTTYNSTPNMYSWYEGQENFNGAYCDVWWINLPNGIPANSNITIYMYVGNSSDNYYQQYYPYVGEAPQLSSTYGQYDNGNYVFLFYDNFAGTILNTSKWSFFTNGIGASITINNGITINGGSYSIAYAGIITLVGFNPTSTIADIYVTYANNTWPSISMTNGNSASSNGYFALWSGISQSYYIGNYYQGIGGSGGYTWSYPAIVSESWQSSSLQIYGSNYTYTKESYISYSLPSSVYYGFGSVEQSHNGIITVQWFRVRAYPPNGVMPSIYIS